MEAPDKQNQTPYHTGTLCVAAQPLQARTSIIFDVDKGVRHVCQMIWMEQDAPLLRSGTLEMENELWQTEITQTMNQQCSVRQLGH
jgi:hypothetical protein